MPRDVASRAALYRCEDGYGVGKTGLAVYLDFATNTERYGRSEATSLGIQNPSKAKIMELGKEVISKKYGNLFEMYEKIR